jgi:hypothetical protein
VSHSFQFTVNEYNLNGKQYLKKVQLSLYLIKEALHLEDVYGSGCIDPRVQDLDSSWGRVVSFMP